MPERPETRYARIREAHIAYQVTGAGPVDLLVTPGFISHLDLQWEGVAYRRFIRQLAGFARVIRYDKRGTGLSDPVAAVPTLEQRADDLAAVLDAAGSAHAVVLGYSESGPTAIRFAVREPGRTQGLVLYGTWSTPPPPEIAQLLRDAVGRWGGGLPWRCWRQACCRVLARSRRPQRWSGRRRARRWRPRWWRRWSAPTSGSCCQRLRCPRWSSTAGGM